MRNFSKLHIYGLDEVQNAADVLTNVILSQKYGDRYTAIDDVEEYPEINRDWEYVNTALCEGIASLMQNIIKTL